MKFKEYLNEAFEFTDEMIDTIKKDCKPFLKYKNFLFRGMSNPNTEMVKKIRRTDRQPLHTDTDLHNIIDNIFLKEWGWKARSQGVFARADYQVNFYGRKHLVFPIGKFTYLWSKLIFDAVAFDKIQHIDKKSGKEKVQVRLFPNDDEKSDYWIHVDTWENYTKDLEMYIKKYYTNKNIQKYFTIKEPIEIMLNVDSYWAVPFGNNMSRDSELDEYLDYLREKFWG